MDIKKIILAATLLYVLSKKKSSTDDHKEVERRMIEEAEIALQYLTAAYDPLGLDYSKIITARLVVDMGVRKGLGYFKTDKAYTMYITNNINTNIYISGIMVTRWGYAGDNPNWWTPYIVSDVKIEPHQTISVSLGREHDTKVNNNQLVNKLLSIREGEYIIGSADAIFLINTGTGKLVGREIKNMEAYIYYRGKKQYLSTEQITPEIKKHFEDIIAES